MGLTAKKICCRRRYTVSMHHQPVFLFRSLFCRIRRYTAPKSKARALPLNLSLTNTS